MLYEVITQIVNGLEFYQRKEIKDVLAYLHLVNNPQNDLALLGAQRVSFPSMIDTTTYDLRNNFV